MPGPVWLILPTYAEVASLAAVVQGAREALADEDLHILVVDDASPDGTGRIADELAAARVGQMDADLSHPPEKLLEMLAALDAREADLVIANRNMCRAAALGWSRARRVLSRVGCTASKLLLGLPYEDLSGGFKLWRASCLADLGLDSMLSAGYAFQVETTQLVHLLGKRFEEVPFVFRERVAGTSKMSLAISLEGIRVTLALRRRRRALQDSNLRPHPPEGCALSS